MEIEFDPAKDEANIAKHGLSLADAAGFDLLSAAVLVDDRADYGEVRYRAFGQNRWRRVRAGVHRARDDRSSDQLPPRP
ncbi:BrnT family toxin [Sphingomonas panni]